jgi:signal transduction histidine kinase
MLDAVGGVATTVWPPAGVALAALLIFGFQLWPAIALGAFLANFSVGVPVLGAVGISIGNTTEALVGGYLLSRIAGFRPALDRLRDVLALVVLASLGSTLISASVGVTSGWLAGVIGSSDYATAWRTWWVGDMLGDLVVAPLLLSWGDWPRVKGRFRRLAEALVLIGWLVAVSVTIFGGWLPEFSDFIGPYFLFPFFIWAAFRFGPRGVTAAIVVVSAIAIGETSAGYGPFVRETVNDSLLLLQTFMGVVAVTFLILAAVVAERRRAEEKARKANIELEQRVLERTEELSALNRELEAFSYSVSHDLRAPLRSLDGFSQALLEDHAGSLDREGSDYLHRIRAASQRMGGLIDDLLVLSRVTRSEIRWRPVDLSAIAHSIALELKQSQPGRDVEFVIARGMSTHGDERLLRVVMDNLLGNAWKFTSKHPRARIEFGLMEKEGQPVYYVRDDGAGFEMVYADSLFGAFQRLHGASEFPGTGIGLATVQRIIRRHGGRIWAEGTVERGATFYFTLSSTAASGA